MKEPRSIDTSSLGERDIDISFVESQSGFELAVGKRFGSFLILGELGRGGMGTVFLARQEAPEREVALKILSFPLAGDPVAIARFQREARLVGTLAHENIVGVLTAGEVGGTPYFAMERIQGTPLSRAIPDRGLPVGGAISIAIQILRALAYAHGRAVIHRDVKPANVLVEESTGRARVVDFGLAREGHSADLTRAGQILGTLAYMPPEQVEGPPDGVDTRSDLYSVGATLYEMLTGRPPFRGDSRLRVAYAILHEEPNPPTRIRPGLPRDLENICLKLLAKEPGRRYRTAQEAIDDLERFQDGRVVLASAPTFTYRLSKWIGRNRASFTVGAVGVVLLGALGVVSLLRLDAARRDAEGERDRNRALLDSNDRVEEGRILLRRALAYQSLTDAQFGKLADLARQARAHFEASMGVVRSAPAAHLIGLTHYLEDRPSLALASFEQAIDLDPEFLPPLVWKGRIHFEAWTARDPELDPGAEEAIAAHESLRAVLSATEHLADPMDELTTRILSALCEGEREAAARTAQDSLQLNPVRAGAEDLLWMAALATETGEGKELLLDQAIRLRPRFSLALLARARCYLARALSLEPGEARDGLLGRAIDDLDHALELRPHLAEAYRERARARRALGDLSMAEDDERRAREELGVDSRQPQESR